MQAALNDLDTLYLKTTQQSLVEWQLHPDPGAHVGHTHLTGWGVAAGKKFQATGHLKWVLEALQQLASSSVTPMKPENLHFTFLAIAKHIYAGPKDVPPLFAQAIAISKKYLPSVKMHISNLRLVALPNTVVLAGLPTEQLLEKRKEYVALMKNTDCWLEIEKFYGNLPIPPPFWHTTLLRCTTQRMPSRVREFFLSQQEACFDDLILEAPEFCAMKSDWSACAVL